MHRIAAVLTSLCLAVGVAACGDDEEDTATTPTTTEARGYTTPTTASDEPFEVQATIEDIGQTDDGDVVLTAESTEGETYEVLVPSDVSLDTTSAEVFADRDCAGKVLANLELVPAPAHETEGDHVLVSAGIDTESCL